MSAETLGIVLSIPIIGGSLPAFMDFDPSVSSLTSGPDSLI
jgi:hypothetical protein